MSQDTRRVDHHPVLGMAPRRAAVTFTFNGRPFTAGDGEMLAAALFANGIQTLRATGREGAPRGLYCAIGHCFECQVRVDGRSGVRACLTPVRDGMVVSSDPFSPDGNDAPGIER